MSAIASRPDIDLKSDEPPNLAELVGGPWGMAESALPAVAYVVAYTATGQETETAAIIAVALALVLTVVRLARRETPRNALSGLIGVAFAAFIASRTGKAEDFFLPGLLMNAGYAAAFLISILVRWPLVGVVVSQLDDDHKGWREDPLRFRTFARASWLWAGLFGLRLAVQLPLYLASAVVALGIARTAMGVPLFALGIWLTWLIVRRLKAQLAALPATPA
jgi:hypothetical protein